MGKGNWAGLGKVGLCGREVVRVVEAWGLGIG
jgi:hypothetical protein